MSLNRVELIEQIARRYNTMWNNNAPALHFRHDPTGFGAQVSRRLLALKIGLIKQRPVSFPDEDMFPYVCLFEPLESVAAIEGSGSIAGEEFDFWKYWEDAAARKEVDDFMTNEADLPPMDLRIVIDGYLLAQLVIKRDFSAKIENEIGGLLLPERYIGAHFRRGDKKVETPLLSADVYRRTIQEVAEKSGLDTVFLASDDPNAPEILDLNCIGLRTIFDSQEKRWNNANHRFLMQNPDQALTESLVAMKNILVLSRAAAVVGQDNAHFATLAASAISVRSASGYYGKLLNGRAVLDESISARSFYRLRTAARSFVKALLPTRTVKGMRARRPMR